METRANYVAVGAFVLIILTCLFIAVLWIAQVQFRREFATYDTYVEGPVTGLSVGASVRFNGIEVGRVSAIDFDPNNSRQVQVQLAVRGDVPIKADSVASLESQGLTGVSYVEISGGSQNAPPPTAKSGERHPIIASKPSSLQRVVENAPEVLARLIIIADRMGELLNDQNRQAIADTLSNVRDATGAFAARRADLESMLADGAKTTKQLAQATDTLNKTLADVRGIVGKAGPVTDHLDEVLLSARDTVRKLDASATAINSLVADSRPQIRDFTTTGLSQLTQLLSEARTLVASLTRVSNQLDRDPQRFLFGDRRKGFNPE